MRWAALRRALRRPGRWLGLAPATGAHEVVAGRDGWLFLCNDTNDVMGQITGRLRAPRRRLAAIAATHAARARLCAADGIAYRHVICPNKESIACDKLPTAFAYESRGSSYVAQYLAAAPAAASFYDRACLIGREDAYFRTDTHWTEIGALAYLEAALRHFGDECALAALTALAAEPAPISVPTDLGMKLGLGPEESVGLELTNGAAELLLESEVANRGHVRVQRCLAPHVAGTRALVLHDSFGLALFRLLSELYGETLFIHDHDFDAAFLRRYRPDVVWMLQAERFLPRMPHNDTDVVAMIERNERRKGKPATGSAFLRETWPA